ncbi:DUF3997 domain-containing protein [Taibaiella helva]|uniref:DUF3997 domain-containing protein n=1 Tax=Taibaiella helva TaxID=2301235 RepID=UPI001300712C|nr:DUF3997 domain-containing protein [Taibaiella helva]
MKNKLALMCSVALFFSCGAGVSDYTEELPGGYQFISESRDEQFIQGNYRFIPCTVLDYCYNQDYILVSQKPKKNCLILPDSPIKNVDTVQFWIIDIVNDSLRGPYKKDDYMDLRRDLNIPAHLKLKIERDW